MPVTFTAIGHPEPGGSKRAVPTAQGPRVVDTNPKSKGWQAEVALSARAAMNEIYEPGELLTGPLILIVDFFLSRPQGHYRQDGYRLKRSAPDRPITRPDTTKMTRSIEDAMSRVVYKDDAQIVTQVCRKHYGIPERAEITVTEDLEGPYAQPSLPVNEARAARIQGALIDDYEDD